MSALSCAGFFRSGGGKTHPGSPQPVATRRASFCHERPTFTRLYRLSGPGVVTVTSACTVKVLVNAQDALDEQETALAGIRHKVLRSQSQLDSLRLDMNAFSDGVPPPYALGDPKISADRSRWVYPLKLRRPMPLMWAIVLGEIVHDLRSALDHCVHQLTLDNKGKELNHTGFPISDKRANWVQMGGKMTADNPLGFASTCAMYQLRGVGKGVLDYIKRLQPHQMANPHTSALWSLHLLWNQDKHRLLLLWGVQLDDAGSVLTLEGADRPGTVTIARGLLRDGDDAVTTTFDGPTTKGTFGGKLSMSVAFENPADRRPGVNDRLWRVHDATAGVVGTLIAAIGQQDEAIP